MNGSNPNTPEAVKQQLLTNVYAYREHIDKLEAAVEAENYAEVAQLSGAIGNSAMAQMFQVTEWHALHRMRSMYPHGKPLWRRKSESWGDLTEGMEEN